MSRSERESLFQFRPQNAFEKWCREANYCDDDPDAPHTEAFFAGYEAGLEQALVESEARCSLCHGVGAIDGFWLGTVKTCPSCHGKGRR